MKIMPFLLTSFLPDLHWGNGLIPFWIFEHYLPNDMSSGFRSYLPTFRLQPFKISVSLYPLSTGRSMICLLILSHFQTRQAPPAQTGPLQITPFCWVFLISVGLKRPHFTAGQLHSAFTSTSRFFGLFGPLWNSGKGQIATLTYLTFKMTANRWKKHSLTTVTSRPSQDFLIQLWRFKTALKTFELD